MMGDSQWPQWLTMMAMGFLFGALEMNGNAARGEDLPAFSYPDTETARQHWEPQYGSRPVRVEKLEDGSPCLVLEAHFTRQGERACWDWRAPLDLSRVGRVGFEVRATNGSLVRTVGIYFGTPNGWYARFWSGLPERWTLRVFRLDTFKAEEQPDGWDRITTFRFSVWSAGPARW